MKNAIHEDEILDAEEMVDGPSDSQLKKVTELSREQLRLAREKERLEGELEKVNAALNANKQKTLPEAMAECRLESFVLGGGYEVETKNITTASIPAPDNKRVENAAHKHSVGIAYMDKMAPDLVKNTITIDYPKGEEKLFRKFMADLKKRKVPVDYKVARSVHSGTLSKWVRDRIAKALEVDEAVLNVNKVTIAEVKAPKEKGKLDG